LWERACSRWHHTGSTGNSRATRVANASRRSSRNPSDRLDAPPQYRIPKARSFFCPTPDQSPEKHWAEWLDGQRDKIRRTLALLEEDAIAELTSHFDVAAISVACALGYLDLRHPDLDWREANPQLAGWYFEVSQRASMLATMPKV
jgi:glutathione S-transferase